MCLAQHAICRRQRGLSMMMFLATAVVVVFIAILGMKVAPAYMEYGKIKEAVDGVAAGGSNTTVRDIRRGFDRRADIDDINAITGRDLNITKDNGQVVVSFAYTKKVPLFSNISLLIDFKGSSSQ